MNTQFNPEDKITVDVPLFIRLLEFAREDAKTDMDLHVVTENAIALSKDGQTLTMDNYNDIVKNNNKEDVVQERLQKLAGINEGISIDIDENTSYTDFAVAVANILREDYGEHNYKPFVQTLITELKKW